MIYQRTTMNNGLRIITHCMPHTRSVSVAFFVGAGGCYEPESQAGISHFIEHLCFKGTEKRRTSKEISEAIEGVGGIINGGTDKELTTYWCKVASQHFLLAVDVLVDLLRNPRFAAEDIERERPVIVEEINMCLDSPRQRVDMLIEELLWPGKPLGRDVAGSKDTVSGLTRSQMLDFFSSHYLPNNTVVSIAGDIGHDLSENTINKVMGDWNPDKFLTSFPSGDAQEAARTRLEFRDSEQVQLCLAVHGLPLQHPDRYALDLLDIAMGEGMSSRLFTEVREKQGLAYEIHSYVDHFTDSGALIIHAGVDPQRVSTALLAILDQLSQLKSSISRVELTKAKELAKGRLLLSLENSRNVAAWLGAQELLTNRILSVDEIISLVDAVTREDLVRVAAQILTSEKLNLAIVGPVKDEKALAQLLEIK